MKIIIIFSLYKKVEKDTPLNQREIIRIIKVKKMKIKSVFHYVANKMCIIIKK